MALFTPEERLLLIGIIDELLISALGTDKQFTDEERNEIVEQFKLVFDEDSPKELRESMTKLARKLYNETIKGGADE